MYSLFLWIIVSIVRLLLAIIIIVDYISVIQNDLVVQLSNVLFDMVS